jgi:redox-sensitive bicupin YhaK (pirin superfamily)
MSWAPCPEPHCEGRQDPQPVETLITPRAHDLGGFEVRRALPSRERQMVGPFIFFDQMGPAEFLTDRGLDVRAHPHIGLATVTYLIDGTIQHRDSLGTEQIIRPGDVNLMTAGRGIAHSERTDEAARASGGRLFGLQCWLALPKPQEERAPAFAHHAAGALPFWQDSGVSLRVVAGSFGSLRSPLETEWEALYVDLGLDDGVRFEIPAETEERALYLLTGRIEVGGVVYDPMQLLVLSPGEALTVRAIGPVRGMLFGGAAMDGPRHIWWNFVSSSKERIEQAKADWAAGRFDPVPGERDPLPLPGR